jgi:hypothetical protein
MYLLAREYWRSPGVDPADETAKNGSIMLDKEVASYNAKAKTQISAADAHRFNPSKMHSKLEHFFSLQDIAMTNVQFGYESPEEVIAKLEGIEEEIRVKVESQKRTVSDPYPESGDIPFIKFGDGWVWWFLDRAACNEEAEAMGHCGNSPRSGSDDRILSLRQPIQKGGITKWSPHLTFILDHNGFLGEMKGRGNDKPAARYHPYIISLFKDPRIKGTKGATWYVSHNFKLSDLTEEERQEIYKANPNFASPEEYYKKHGKDPALIERIANKLHIEPDKYKPEWDAYIIEQWDDVQEFVRRKGEGYADEAMEYALKEKPAAVEGTSESSDMPSEEEVAETIMGVHRKGTYGGGSSSVPGVSDASIRNIVAGLKREVPDLVREFEKIQGQHDNNPKWNIERDSTDQEIADLLYFVFQNTQYTTSVWQNIKTAYVQAEENDYHWGLVSDLEFELTQNISETSDSMTELRFGDDDEFGWKAAPVYEILKFKYAVELASDDAEDEKSNFEDGGKLHVYVSEPDGDREGSDQPMEVLDEMYKNGTPTQRNEDQLELFKPNEPRRGEITPEQEEEFDEAVPAEEELAEAGD